MNREPAIAPFIYPWPSRAHRSLAEVAETARLQKLPQAGLSKLGMTVRLDNLLRKARAFNPPPDDPEAA